METIEQRANEFTKWFTNNGTDAIAQAINNSFTAGCRSQNKIDIEKACKWLKGHAFAFAEAECTSTWDAVAKYDTDQLINQFRKAMDE